MPMNDEVRKALKELDAAHDQRFAPWRNQWQTIRARLVELEAERWSVVATRNAAVMRAEKAEALLRSCNAACKRVIEQDGGILGGIDFNALGASLTTHLSEPRP